MGRTVRKRWDERVIVLYDKTARGAFCAFFFGGESVYAVLYACSYPLFLNLFFFFWLGGGVMARVVDYWAAV